MEKNSLMNVLTNNKQVYLSGKNGRLYWQDELEGYEGEITENNRHIVCAGWNVITWKGKKPVSIYFGQSFEDALNTFQAKENE